MADSCECYALIEEGPRAELFRDLFKDDKIPLESPNLVTATGGDYRGDSFYKVAVNRMNVSQQRELARRLEPKFKQPLEQIFQDMNDPKHGIPLRSFGVKIVLCTLHSHAPLRCSKCGNEIYLTKEDLEKPVFCKKCGTFVSAPIRSFI